MNKNKYFPKSTFEIKNASNPSRNIYGYLNFFIIPPSNKTVFSICFPNFTIIPYKGNYTMIIYFFNIFISISSIRYSPPKYKNTCRNRCKVLFYWFYHHTLLKNIHFFPINNTFFLFYFCQRIHAECRADSIFIK